MAVPLLDVNAQNLALEGEFKSAFERVLRSGQFILGAEVSAFEKMIAQMTGATHAIGVSSGTDALILALMSAGIGAGDEVLCPTYTFFATAGSIARVGARPVFIDADPFTFNLDVEDAARKVSSRTKAVIPVHLFGQAAAMNEVMDLAARHNLFVLEDAAQSLGAKYNGRHLGTIGHMGAYSFFPSKNLGGFGDGGMLVTNDAHFADRARALRTHGGNPKYYHKYVGGNFRLDALQAALLAVKVPHHEMYIRLRQDNALYYTERLAQLPGVGHMDGNTSDVCIRLPVVMDYNVHIWNQYTVRISGSGNREALRTLCSMRGIGTEVYYPLPMHAQECFKSCGYVPADLPIAMQLASEALSIPIYPELMRSQQDEIIETIREFVGQL